MAEGNNRTIVSLAEGTVLKDRYRVDQVIGMGGFGITYRCWDLAFERIVAIKEYYPSNLVTRVGGVTVSVLTEELEDEYQHGVNRFLTEARDLFKFSNNPGIVSIFDFFRENETAYMVMEYLDGCTLKEYLDNRNGRIDEAMAIQVIFSLAGTMDDVHAAGMVHRDISPDNIFICRDHRITLIDFGAAKLSEAVNQRSVSIVLKHGYAPIEQYSSSGKIGPWTDIYAFGALMYYMMTGQKPAESVERVVEDNLIPPRNLNPNIPDYMERVMLKALAVQAKDRYQNMGELQADLLSGSPSNDGTGYNTEAFTGAGTGYGTGTDAGYYYRDREQGVTETKPWTEVRGQVVGGSSGQGPDGSYLYGQGPDGGFSFEEEIKEETSGTVRTGAPEKVSLIKKLMLILAIVAVVAGLGIFFLSVFSSNTQKTNTDTENKDTSATQDASKGTTQGTTKKTTEGTEQPSTKGTTQEANNNTTEDNKKEKSITGNGKKVVITAFNQELGTLLDDFLFRDYPELKDYVVYQNVGLNGSSKDYMDIAKNEISGGGSASIVCVDSWGLSQVIESAPALSSIGFDESKYRDSYVYTQREASSKNRELKAVTWQVSPGMLIYRSDIALTVFGTSEPAEIEKIFSDVDHMKSAFAKLKKAGFYPMYSAQDFIRPFLEHADSPCYLDGKINPDAMTKEGMELAKQFASAGYFKGEIEWSEEWLNSFGDDVFCYFGPPWLVGQIDGGTMDAYTDSGEYSFFNVIPCPKEIRYWHWGGTYYMVTEKVDNPELAAFILEYISGNASFMKAYLDTYSYGGVNNSSIQATYRPSVAALAGQSPHSYYDVVAKGIKGTNYDSVYVDRGVAASTDYANGTASYDDVISYMETGQ